MESSMGMRAARLLSHMSLAYFNKTIAVPTKSAKKS